VAKYQSATSTTKYFLCGDRSPQLIYETEPNEYIDFRLEIDGIGPDSWVVSGARFLPSPRPNQLPQAGIFEVITIRQNGITRSGSVPYWQSSGPYNEFNKIVFLGNASWGITFVSANYEISGLVGAVISTGHSLAAELDTITSTGSLYTGQVTPTDDPFSRVVHKRDLGVRFNFFQGADYSGLTLDEMRTRAGIDFGDKNDSVSTADDSMVITPAPIPLTQWATPDCGEERGIGSQDHNARIKTLNYFIQGNSISVSEGLVNSKSTYHLEARQLKCASATNYISDMDFSGRIGSLFTTGSHTVQRNELIKSENISILFKFSPVYPPVTVTGERNANYRTGRFERNYNGAHIGSVFNNGKSYFYQAEHAARIEVASFPAFVGVPPLSGERTPMQVILSPGMPPIAPLFPPDFAVENGPTGFHGDSDSLRWRKRWRVDNGVLYCDKVVTPTAGIPGVYTEIDRFIRGESVSINVFSYRMALDGQFTRVNTQSSRLASLAGTEAVDGNLLEALYYGN
jgi:hypothetical protein